MMLQRCYNSAHVSYHDYGGRGITVCEDWKPDMDGPRGSNRTNMMAFHNFIRDVGIKPSKIHTLDRLNANLHYTKDNVKWSTPKEQGVNKRDTHFVLHPRSGLRVAAASLADELGVSYQVLRARMMNKGTWYALKFAEVPTTVQPLGSKEGAKT